MCGKPGITFCPIIIKMGRPRWGPQKTAESRQSRPAGPLFAPPPIPGSVNGWLQAPSLKCDEDHRKPILAGHIAVVAWAFPKEVGPPRVELG